MPRSYRLGKREEAVVASRMRIVEVARELMSRPDYRGVTVESVAEAAGVSRATVYNQFESKLGILQAIFNDIGQRIEYDRVRDALADPDPIRALDRVVEEHCRAWARDARAIRRVFALAVTDPELAELTSQNEGWRRKDIRALVERLRREGALLEGWNDADATAALATLTSFSMFDQLVTAGLRGASIERTLRKLAHALVEATGKQTRARRLRTR
jgi:AcrR family transcriptional regulator